MIVLRELDENSLPLVSIGLFVYNGEKFIDRAIISLLKQTYSKIEIIISDNASTDSTYELCVKWAKIDNRIQLYRNNSNLGSKRNMENVLSKASGEYFMFAANDDYWEEKFIETLVDELEMNPLCDIALSGIQFVDQAENKIKNITFEDSLSPNNLNHYKLSWWAAVEHQYYYMYIYGLYRTLFIKKLFPYMPNYASADRALIIIAALITRFRYVNEILFNYTIHRDVKFLERHFKNDVLLKEAYIKKYARYTFPFKLFYSIISCNEIAFKNKIYAPILVLRAIMEPIRTLFF